ncbi:ribonuclease P protein component [Dissulfurimicrobium sp.]|uniref:ribonuclease P protein component n=1 Tax=Dissulfurimicrobium sp. TaxID=2022436 RepID=UPI003D0EA625
MYSVYPPLLGEKNIRIKQAGLLRSERLCGKGAFGPIFKARRRVRLPCLTVVYAPNGLSYRRMGISIGKNYGNANAVERNRVKRLVRELFRRNKDIFPVGCDVVFIPHVGFLNIEINTYCRMFEDLFKDISSTHRKTDDKDKNEI